MTSVRSMGVPFPSSIDDKRRRRPRLDSLQMSQAEDNELKCARSRLEHLKRANLDLRQQIRKNILGRPEDIIQSAYALEQSKENKRVENVSERAGLNAFVRKLQPLSHDKGSGGQQRVVLRSGMDGVSTAPSWLGRNVKERHQVIGRARAILSSNSKSAQVESTPEAPRAAFGGLDGDAETTVGPSRMNESPHGCSPAPPRGPLRFGKNVSPKKNQVSKASPQKQVNVVAPESKLCGDRRTDSGENLDNFDYETYVPENDGLEYNDADESEEEDDDDEHHQKPLNYPVAFLELRDLIEIHLDYSLKLRDLYEQSEALREILPQDQWTDEDWKKENEIQSSARTLVEEAEVFSQAFRLYPDLLWTIHELYTERKSLLLELQELDVEYMRIFGEGGSPNHITDKEVRATNSMQGRTADARTKEDEMSTKMESLEIELETLEESIRTIIEEYNEEQNEDNNRASSSNCR